VSHSLLFGKSKADGCRKNSLMSGAQAAYSYQGAYFTPGKGRD
jgi:hypothetical protein